MVLTRGGSECPDRNSFFADTGGFYIPIPVKNRVHVTGFYNTVRSSGGADFVAM